MRLSGRQSRSAEIGWFRVSPPSRFESRRGVPGLRARVLEDVETKVAVTLEDQPRMGRVVPGDVDAPEVVAGLVDEPSDFWTQPESS